MRRQCIKIQDSNKHACSKRIFYMYFIVLYNRVLGNNYFIIVITILYFNEKITFFETFHWNYSTFTILELKIFKIKHSFFLTKTGFKFVEWNTKLSEHSVHIIYKVSKYMQSIKIRPN